MVLIPLLLLLHTHKNPKPNSCKQKKRFGRDNFQEALRLSHRLDPSQIDWKKFKYMVFDQPHHKGTYEQAYAELGTIPFLERERERPQN